MSIAILGFGIVGSGTFDVINENKSEIFKKSGVNVEVKYIVDVKDLTGTIYEKMAVNDFSIVENDKEVDVVVEVIGGATFAYEFTKRALKAGKNVVSSNKELVAMHGTELLKLAKENNVQYKFEASVGGGTPIIKPLIECLVANEIMSITGIVNGTTNYILQQMIENGLSFDDAIKQAQQMGFAEKDPSADINGIDPQRKICILSNIAFGKEIKPENVFAKGISEITLQDVEFANRDNKVIKLLGRMEKQSGKTFVFSAPYLVDKNNVISNANGVYNAILVEGNMVEDVVFYGKGAGKNATASSVVADIIDIYKTTPQNQLLWTESDNIVSDIKEFESRFYVKYDKSSKNIFENHKVLSNDSDDKIAIITEKMVFGEFLKGVESLENASYSFVL